MEVNDNRSITKLNFTSNTESRSSGVSTYKCIERNHSFLCDNVDISVEQLN
jgi:hypothetical protein